MGKKTTTSQQSNTTVPPVTTPAGLSGAVGTLFSVLPTITSVVIGFTAFAYIVGWLHARAYFVGFGASWLVSEIPTTSLLGFSWLPLTQLLFFIFLGTTDLMESGERYKITFFVLRHGSWLVLLLYLVTLLLEQTSFHAISASIETFLPVAFATVAAAAVESIIIRLQSSNNRFDLGMIYLVYGLVLFGFYFVPQQMGRNDAKRDRDLNRSTLACVVLKEDSGENLRLLATGADRIFAVALDSTSSPPRVHVIYFRDVDYFVPPPGKD